MATVIAVVTTRNPEQAIIAADSLRLDLARPDDRITGRKITALGGFVFAASGFTELTGTGWNFHAIAAQAMAQSDSINALTQLLIDTASAPFGAAVRDAPAHFVHDETNRRSSSTDEPADAQPLDKGKNGR